MKKVEIIYSFEPTKEDRARMKEITENALYKFESWVPEANYAPGDICIYYNDVNDIEPEWLRNVVIKHPYWTKELKKKVTKNSKKVKIMQVKDEFTHEHAFMPYNMLVKLVGGIDFDKYETVYVCYRDSDYTPEDAFFEFNMNHPAEYKARSLSVSDILIMDNEVMYCDSFGFKNLLVL